MSGNYSIVSAQLPLVGGLGGHNLVAVLDPSGHVITEFDGLATSASGAIKPIGYLPSDQLKVYEFDNGTGYFKNGNSTNLKDYTLFQSSNINDIDSRISAMQTCMSEMNGLNLNYPFMGLGKNSNSVDSTMIDCIGATELPMPNGAWITPGVGSILLPQTTINATKALNNINNNFIEGDPVGSQFNNSWPTPSYGDEGGNFG